MPGSTLPPMKFFFLLRRVPFVVFSTLVFLSIVMLPGCNTRQTRAIVEEALFTLKLGVQESNINFFSFSNVSTENHPSIIMRNGIFAISDPANSKIMEFTSYGDLLNLYYNTQKNPPPLTLRIQSPGSNSTTLVNKLAFPYPFEYVGHIAYTRTNMLLVQDQVPASRVIYDDQRGVFLNQVILRFNSRGEYQDYIGQEGIGGTAFPAIQSIQVTRNNHIVVNTQVPSGNMIFWYNELGDLLYSVEIEPQHLPAFDQPGYYPVLDSIVAHPSRAYLLLKMDYHPQNQFGGIDSQRRIQSRVFQFDLEQAVYTNSFELPANTQPRHILSQAEAPETQYLYQLLGVDDRGTLFFLSRLTDIQHQLLLTDETGRVLQRIVIQLNDAELMFRELWVNEQGILVGLLIYPDHGKVVWWRTDRLLYNS